MNTETINDIKQELRNISERASRAIMWNEDCVTTYPTIAGKQLWFYFAALADRIEKAVTNCNQLKMRSALECIDSIAKYLEAGTIRDIQHAYRNIQDRVRIALSAPPRNCDLYSHDEALRIWSSLPESKENGCFDEWLFAEAKGETK